MALPVAVSLAVPVARCRLMRSSPARSLRLFKFPARRPVTATGTGSGSLRLSLSLAPVSLRVRLRLPLALAVHATHCQWQAGSHGQLNHVTVFWPCCLPQDRGFATPENGVALFSFARGLLGLYVRADTTLCLAGQVCSLATQVPTGPEYRATVTSPYPPSCAARSSGAPPRAVGLRAVAAARVAPAPRLAGRGGGSGGAATDGRRCSGPHSMRGGWGGPPRG